MGYTSPSDPSNLAKELRMTTTNLTIREQIQIIDKKIDRNLRISSELLIGSGFLLLISILMLCFGQMNLFVVFLVATFVALGTAFFLGHRNHKLIGDKVQLLIAEMEE